MSRRTSLWKKKIGSAWSTRKAKGGTQEHRSGNGGDIEALIPTRRVTGKGTYLRFQDANGEPTDQGLRGVGHMVTEPMSPDKEMRIRRLVK